MKLEHLYDMWINNAHESINVIQYMLESDKEYDQEFVELAKFILETDINLWQILPSGWEGSLGSAQSTESLLHEIHHALVDDGDICWIDTKVHGPFLEFADRWETDHIHKIVEKRFRNVLPGEYSIRQYSSEFITTLIKYEEDWKRRVEALDKRMGIINDR